jgi:hypothetical protein
MTYVHKTNLYNANQEDGFSCSPWFTVTLSQNLAVTIVVSTRDDEQSQQKAEVGQRSIPFCPSQVYILYMECAYSGQAVLFSSLCLNAAMHIIKDTTASNMILKSEVSVQNASVSKVH